MTLQFGFQAFNFTAVTQVQSVVRELRSLMLRCVAKKKKKLYQIMKYKITTTAAAKLLQSVRLFAILSTVAHQALMSMGLSRKEYWSGLP